MSHQEVKVKRQQLAACITCHLCKELLTDATTITECLHSFCRECIYKKLADGKSKCCPVCDIDLGCSPLEKLRGGHNIQDVRHKLFPSKEIKKKSPEPESLSLLVLTTPGAATWSTRKRSESTARKASRGPNFTIGKSFQKEDEDQLGNSSLPDSLNKYGQNSAGKLKGSNTLEGNGDLWEPLNCLVEAANMSMSLEFGGQGSAAETNPLYPHDEGAAGNKIKEKRRNKSKVQDEKNARDSAPLVPEMPKKNHKVRAKKAHNIGDIRVPPQVILDASRAKLDRKDIPVWFSLVAHEEQEANGPPLPQISANYIRVKDGSIPVSSIQKYLKGKLGLSTEDEVDIKCMGQTVIPSLTLNTLIKLWLETTTADRVAARVGSSAKEFVMVLGYASRPSVS